MLDNGCDSAFVPGRFSGQQRRVSVLDLHRHMVHDRCTYCLHGSDLATEFSALFSRPVMLKTALHFSALW